MSLACAVCFGGESAMADGITYGVITLVGVVGIVLSCIAWFMVSLIRRGRKFNVSINHQC